MLDVYQAENVLGATQATVPQLTIQLQKGLNALRVQLGIAPEPLGFLLAGRRAGSPSRLRKSSLVFRRTYCAGAPTFAPPNYARQRKARKSAWPKRISIPAISITGSFGGIANNVGGHNLLQVFQPIGRSFSVGPSFQWNLLNYGQITNNVRLQDATLQQYLVDYQNTVLKAQQEVENGISSFLLSRVQAEYLRRSVVAADGALHIATLEYQQGTRDFTTVLTAEQNLYQAQNNLAVATGNIATGLVSVFRGLGGGWQIRDGNGFVNAATTEEMRQPYQLGPVAASRQRAADAGSGFAWTRGSRPNSSRAGMVRLNRKKKGDLL